MTFPVLAVIGLLSFNQLWYAAPLVVSVSLVYGATRDEDMAPILVHSYRAAIWILSFLVTVFLVLLVVSWFV